MVITQSSIADTGSNRITIMPITSGFTTVQGTWVPSMSAANFCNGALVNSGGGSPAINDEYNLKFRLQKGTYSFAIYYTRTSSSGIATISINGASIGTADAYAASTGVTTTTVTGISITDSTQRTLSIKIASKNGASSNYTFNCSMMEFYRTA